VESAIAVFTPMDMCDIWYAAGILDIAINIRVTSVALNMLLSAQRAPMISNMQ
jgi:hypothetical protein